MSNGTIYRSKSAKTSISYMAWVVFTTFLIGIVGVVTLVWGLLIQFDAVEPPKIPWSSLELASLAFLYLAGSLMNGYKPRHPYRAGSERRAHRQDSVHQDATRQP